MSSTTCNCSQTSGGFAAPANVGERPRFYARQLVEADDLILEHEYLRAKLRRHNRFLHGWGVVCGARVVLANQPWKVVVKTGYILSPYGDEICIGKDQCVDVRTTCTSSAPPEPVDDCGCTEASPPIPAGQQMFIAIRYVEKPARLVRVPLGGCGCNESACEYARYVELLRDLHPRPLPGLAHLAAGRLGRDARPTAGLPRLPGRALGGPERVHRRRVRQHRAAGMRLPPAGAVVRIHVVAVLRRHGGLEAAAGAGPARAGVRRAVTGTPRLSPALLVRLQRTAGNQAVLCLLARAGGKPPTLKETSEVPARANLPAPQLRLSLWQRLRDRVRWRRLPASEPPRLLLDPP